MQHPRELDTAFFTGAVTTPHWLAAECATDLTVMLALPMSPLDENLMPSLVTEITTVSPMLARSLRDERQVIVSKPFNRGC